jgi:surface protein
MKKTILLSLLFLSLSGCGGSGGAPTSVGEGPSPSIPTDPIISTSLAFITKWEIPSDEVFELPLSSTESGYNFTIDWGDGSEQEVINNTDNDSVAEASHSYSVSSGTSHTISITGVFPSFNSSGGESPYLIEVVNLGKVGWKDLHNAFGGFVNLTKFTSGNTDTSEVTDMSSMFIDNENLVSVDLSTIDSSAVTDMSSMFEAVTSLETLDLSSFVTSSLVITKSMFGDMDSLTHLDLTNFNIPNTEERPVDQNDLYGTFNNTDIDSENIILLDSDTRTLLGI